MRRKSLCFTIAAVLCMFGLTGCQKAPDVVEKNGIMHAQGDMEKQMQGIAAEGSQEQMQAGDGLDKEAGQYQGTVGTDNNIININAEIPALPDQLYIITMKPDEGLDKDILLAFLDSESGSVEDTSQELLQEIEESDRYNSTPDENGERFLYSKFGDHSANRLGDGKKEASFSHHTSAYYLNYGLREKYFEVYSKDEGYSKDDKETLVSQEGMDEGSFSADRAREILLDKLKAVGVSELAFQKIYYIEGDDSSFYQMEFVPAYDGIAVDIGADSYALGQVSPNGYAIVSREGVAEVTLTNFCGRVTNKEPVTVISFEQVLEILEQYLDSGILESDGTIIYDRVELNYYPVPNSVPALDEIEYKPELVLMPIWHIYMPLDEYVEGDYGDAVGPVHICVNAVTGELEEAD